MAPGGASKNAYRGENWKIFIWKSLQEYFLSSVNQVAVVSSVTVFRASTSVAPIISVCRPRPVTSPQVSLKII